MLLDFLSDYWQVGISPETRAVTTFITERGKYVWNVLPQGLRCSSDHFLRISNEALRRGGLSGYIKNFDDILLFSKTLLEKHERGYQKKV